MAALRLPGGVTSPIVSIGEGMRTWIEGYMVTHQRPMYFTSTFWFQLDAIVYLWTGLFDPETEDKNVGHYIDVVLQTVLYLPVLYYLTAYVAIHATQWMASSGKEPSKSTSTPPEKVPAKADEPLTAKSNNKSEPLPEPQRWRFTHASILLHILQDLLLYAAAIVFGESLAAQTVAYIVANLVLVPIHAHCTYVSLQKGKEPIFRWKPTWYLKQLGMLSLPSLASSIIKAATILAVGPCLAEFYKPTLPRFGWVIDQDYVWMGILILASLPIMIANIFLGTAEGLIMPRGVQLITAQHPAEMEVYYPDFYSETTLRQTIIILMVSRKYLTAYKIQRITIIMLLFTLPTIVVMPAASYWDSKRMKSA